MQPNDLPILCLPLDLSDEAAASLIQFLQELTTALERHYFDVLISSGKLPEAFREHRLSKRSAPLTA